MFQIGETVICSCEIRDTSDILKDPSDDTAATSTHTMIQIVDKNGTVKVEETTGMTRDSVGEYHYDCQTTGYVAGKCEVKYIATDGTRISYKKETFSLE